MKKILIITNGGFKMGLGHVYRSIALAKQLSQSSEVSFLTASGKVVVNKIRENAYTVFKIKSFKDFKTKLSQGKYGTIVIDTLTVDEKIAKFIRSYLGLKLVIFGNISSANKYADVVINAIIGTKFKNKSFIDKKTKTLYLEGPKYLVLREEFYRYKNSNKYRNKLERILLIFGGSDQANLTTRILNKLLSMDNNFKISIVLGPAFKFYKELTKTLKKYINRKNNITIYKDINNVSKLMVNTDLVITSPGTTIFESFSIGVPTVAFFQNTFERNMFSGFLMCYELNKIKNLRSFLFTIYGDYFKHKKRIAKLEVAAGKNEIINNILGGYRK